MTSQDNPSKTQIKALAEAVATSFAKPKTNAWVQAHDAFLLGWATASAQCVALLKKQYEGGQPRTLVSYAIAAEVLALDMKEFENKGAEP